MRLIPTWSWMLAAVGLAAILGGAFLDPSYASGVLLQLGSAALLLVPIVVVERSIGRRLERRIDDQGAIRKAEAALDLDDIWRDFGQKLGADIEAHPRSEVARVLGSEGWERYRSLDKYSLWRKGDRRLAVPDTADDSVPAPIVRRIQRVLDMTNEEFLAATGRTDD